MTERDIKPYIHIEFDDLQSLIYKLEVSPGVSVEQIAMIAAKLSFLANHAWEMNELQKQMEQQQQQIAKVKPGILKPS